MQADEVQPGHKDDSVEKLEDFIRRIPARAVLIPLQQPHDWMPHEDGNWHCMFVYRTNRTMFESQGSHATSKKEAKRVTLSLLHSMLIISDEVNIEIEFCERNAIITKRAKRYLENNDFKHLFEKLGEAVNH